jgi:hypothetical protein
MATPSYAAMTVTGEMAGAIPTAAGCFDGENQEMTKVAKTVVMISPLNLRMDIETLLPSLLCEARQSNALLSSSVVVE